MKTAIIALLLATAGSASAETLTVCATDKTCRFTGDSGIQAAVDAAKDGDTVLIKAGVYHPTAYRDVPFQDLALRGYVVIDHKRLTISGEAGSIIDGKTGNPSIAFVVQDADVAFKNLSIRDFRYAEEEDKIYDGHGIFAINSRVRIDDVMMERIIKMGITGRGDSLIDATNVRLLDGHLGVWLEESAHARLRNMVIRGGDSAAIGAYMTSSATLSNSVIDGNTDDGVYAKDHASIVVTNSLILNNKPFGVNIEGEAHIVVARSALHGNATDFSDKVTKGEGLILADPLIDVAYRPKAGSPLSGVRDPDLNRPIGLDTEGDK
ncbi:right-handed parallel beta-helix repeat-containing protein [Asticcacaulis sp.]|uniref:right-handed parallel beta-helix repeat-containing protein n=1 Tax=Asticcacaulis sp. TaxID=1872648 RepID=UPI002C058584|nr:right-handed parallel beta-helix repeat-containing protein [Asticcacaulis sp.]HTM81390.1 right-handed parallel beta-helix repeat-containing protein [Asticcacaulis sp.]